MRRAWDSSIKGSQGASNRWTPNAQHDNRSAIAGAEQGPGRQLHNRGTGQTVDADAS